MFYGKEYRHPSAAILRRLFMIQRLFIAFIVIVAVVAGICAMSLPRDSIAHLVMFRDFFDMALPILAFGALVKYLCACCCASDYKCKCNCGSSTCTCVKK
jgi:hypothetical protein